MRNGLHIPENENESGSAIRLSFKLNDIYVRLKRAEILLKIHIGPSRW